MNGAEFRLGPNFGPAGMVEKPLISVHTMCAFEYIKDQGPGVLTNNIVS